MALEYQVNIVLEDSPGSSLQTTTVRMVGFVLIDNVNITLSELRVIILEELDDQQLAMIGTGFKFLKKTFPVSSKQETRFRIDRICLQLHSNPHNARTVRFASRQSPQRIPSRSRPLDRDSISDPVPSLVPFRGLILITPSLSIQSLHQKDGFRTFNGLNPLSMD